MVSGRLAKENRPRKGQRPARIGMKKAACAACFICFVVFCCCLLWFVATRNRKGSNLRPLIQGQKCFRYTTVLNALQRVRSFFAVVLTARTAEPATKPNYNVVAFDEIVPVFVAQEEVRRLIFSDRANDISPR